MIDVTVAGTAKRRQVLTRSGARPGDDVYVSGTIGGARAGLLLLKGTSTEVTDTNGSHGSSNESPLPKEPFPPFVSVPTVVAQYWRPEPRARLGVWLGRNRAASACIDLSDGLADGVHRLAEASGVGIAVDASALPIDAGTRSAFEARGDDAVEEAIAGGDDYELLFTVRRRMRRSVAAGAQHTGLPLTRIGTCTDGPAVVLRRAGAEAPLAGTGFDHFTATRPGFPVHE